MKSLEALEKIKNAPTIYVGLASDIYTRYLFECKEIEKSLKALEIIKNKKVNVYELFSDKVLNPNCDDKTLCWNYNLHKEDYRCLTQEEYDLLKEVLL